MKEQFAVFQEQTIARQQRLQGKDTEEAIQKLERELFDIYTPKPFSGANGQEAKFIKDFEIACVMIGQHVAKDPKKMTVMGFHQAIETLTEQFKERKKK